MDKNAAIIYLEKRIAQLSIENGHLKQENKHLRPKEGSKPER